MSFLRQLIKSNLEGRPAYCPSICSAQPDVLAASFLLAKKHDRDVIIEATSNQVNQFGGYTGMRPADYIENVNQIAEEAGYPKERITFGGDHLGPQVWRSESADIAMGHAKDMMKEYVEAGFCKIHLDCSEGCAGEAAQVSDQLSAERAAILAEVCYNNAPDPEKLTFVVGTEVPPPGGARPEHDEGVLPTTAEAAVATLEAQKSAFDAIDTKLWGHVVALVVQPGVEFSPSDIDHLDVMSKDLLSPILPKFPNICFEAHSTDYQHDAVFEELGKRHFAILKVGPALTFGYREALYTLSHIDQWLNGSSHISQLMGPVMEANPKHWQGHYTGTPEEIINLLHFSYADRIRYYWPEPVVAAEVVSLKRRLSESTPDQYLLQAFISQPVLDAASVWIDQGVDWPQAVIYAKIQEKLLPYFSMN